MTISDLKYHVQKCGSHFFDKDTMRFFKSKVEAVYEGSHGIYFVTSEQPPHGPRKYSVRHFDRKGCRVTTIGSSMEYSRAEAMGEARKLSGKKVSNKGRWPSQDHPTTKSCRICGASIPYGRVVSMCDACLSRPPYRG